MIRHSLFTTGCCLAQDSHVCSPICSSSLSTTHYRGLSIGCSGYLATNHDRLLSDFYHFHPIAWLNVLVVKCFHLGCLELAIQNDKYSKYPTLFATHCLRLTTAVVGGSNHFSCFWLVPTDQWCWLHKSHDKKGPLTIRSLFALSTHYPLSVHFRLVLTTVLVRSHGRVVAHGNFARGDPPNSEEHPIVSTNGDRGS